ncbi:probable dihydrolipoamide acetyltransferase component of pyruvate dehydrogenase complex, mitochondrial precursor [Melanopsichium pennsylvanicum]|uniref:Acetyltransferase component of pyruvate dehydrogenase complex n=2 Tax=Melanopsichium pennsylvanicum TaxID=63383 RepID=A0AAJ4XHN8_9BASI|nr:probable dihydrolipoamide acetyltransferase component of pyruvate dehydrogenase complex, mitochondrial precursor [Melanopsichium pennsylvanicum 4]SNX81926.1 probable dihydrolipoamide acetyltransferase component of pyruvate dehydrogenase complex, mitochondrial precursor [Melanopsichium pennsylvanicum]
MQALRALQRSGLQRAVATASSSSPRSFHSSRRALEFSKFNMPAMSPTMTEGGIAAWKKQPGDAFSAGDVLLEIETDKATMDVEAQEDGVLAKILVGDGSKAVQVNSLIAIMAEEGDDLSGADAFASKAASEGGDAKPAAKEEPKEESKPAQQPKQESAPASSSSSSSSSSSGSSGSSFGSQSSGNRIFATPVARRLAQEKGIALDKIKGTGPEGRIIKADVENYKPEAAAATAPSKSTSAAAPSKPAAAPAPTSSEGDYTDIPVSNMRRTIAARLTESKSTVPHYYVSIDVEMDKVLKLREVFNKAAAEKAGKDVEKAKAAKLSVGDFITKAAGVALKEVPEVNSAWYGDFIRQHNKADISIAVSTPTGLITPIVKDVGGSGLATISAATKQLAAKARSGKLAPQEYQGGSFTISNMGMFGITHFTAIINPPQSCILAIGGTEARLIPDAESEQGFRKAMVMQATISADHRTVDGATAAKWMKAFKDALENPLSFML